MGSRRSASPHLWSAADPHTEFDGPPNSSPPGRPTEVSSQRLSEQLQSSGAVLRDVFGGPPNTARRRRALPKET